MPNPTREGGMPLDDQQEIFYWVDENDIVLGEVSRQEAHSGSMKIHRTVGVLVFNENGEILLQQRSLQKDLDPGKWTISAGGHVTVGESYDEAAKKELQEELGIEATLKLIKKVYVITPVQREYVSMYKVTVDKNTKFNFDKDEVQTVEWIPQTELAHFIDSNPFSGWAKDVLQHTGYLK